MKLSKFKIKGMDCPACATLIEMDLQDAGFNAKCSYKNEELTITHDADKEPDRENIKKIVKKSGYETI